jgi:hypothetical protein
MVIRIKRETDIFLVLMAASMLIYAGAYVFSVDFVYSTSSQENNNIKDSNNTLNATTKCIGFGADSESSADTQLSSNGNNIIQQCEQTISSADSNGGSNIATNTVQGNNNADGNQVNQESNQKIGD